MSNNIKSQYTNAITPEAMQEAMKVNKKIADNLSQEMGYKDAKDFIETHKVKLNSKNAATRAMGERSVGDWFGNLLLLCLYQHIENQQSFGYMNSFADAFDDGVVDEGNAKEYIANKITGVSTYLADQFVPTKRSTKSVENYVIQMYDSAGTLNNKAYQFKKSQTIEAPEYIPYFKKGALNEFIAGLTAQIYIAYEMFKFDKIAKLITTATPQKTIAGKATNMFDAFVEEIFPEWKEMTFANTQYNYKSSSKYVHSSSLNDLIVIMSSKNLQRLNSGIKTQLFNAQFFGVDSELKNSDIISLGNQIVIGDEDTPISVSSTPYVDDNTLWIVDRRYVKHILQINRKETQMWAENMTISIVLHIWGAADILPWCPMIKYTNENLSVQPNKVE